MPSDARRLSRRDLLSRAGTLAAVTLSASAGLGAAGGAPSRGVARAEPSEARGLRVGEPPPPLALERLSGSDEVSLDRLEGRVVIVDFWASWCGPCRRVMPVLDGLHRRLHDRGLSVVGVSREGPRTIRAFLEYLPVEYTVARDVGGTQLRYGVTALPTLCILDRRGILREVQIGLDHLGQLPARVEQMLAEG